MFYVSDLAALVETWLQRLQSLEYPDAYRDALSDCTYEVIEFMNNAINEEMKALSKLTPGQKDDWKNEYFKQAAEGI